MNSSALFNRYVIKNLLVTTVFMALTLTAIILLTQSLKFLELIINSGASSATFWTLTILTMPRFFEVILPIALMISTLFIYNRMTSDSELVVMRAAGISPLGLSRPAISFALITTIFLLFITMWATPVSLGSMQKLRQVVKTQYSALLFREGIFNSVGKDLTVYIDNRNSKGELEGLLIHDSRDELEAPTTVVAKRGIIVDTDQGQQVLVYEGSRQDFNVKTGALNRLNFERYSIDLPEPEAVKKRWKEPDERTFWELLNPDFNISNDVKYKKDLVIEAHKRVVGPFLALCFTIVVLCFLLIGPLNRRGQTKRIFMAAASVILLQSLYLSVFNFAGKNIFGITLLYLLVFTPIIFGFILLSSMGEKVRHRYLYHVSKSEMKAKGKTS